MNPLSTSVGGLEAMQRRLEELEQENLQPAGGAPGEVAPLHTEAGAYFEA